MWDLIVSVPDHCLSFYFRGYYMLTVALPGISANMECRADMPGNATVVMF